MGYSDQHIGHQAARQGLGMPGDASLATQDAYNREIARQQGEQNAKLLAGMGMPKAPTDASGLVFLLLLPLLAVWFVFADLVSGWRRWRVGLLLLGVLIAAAAFVVGLAIDIQAEIEGREAARAVVGTVEMFQNVGAGGLCVIVFALLPRTLVALGLFFGLLTAWNTWLAPLI